MIKFKRIVAHDTLLAYSDFNVDFKTHTDASKFKLGAVIREKGKPNYLYSRKLTDAQKTYTITKEGLLSIIETLKEFRTILIDKISKI